MLHELLNAWLATHILMARSAEAQYAPGTPWAYYYDGVASAYECTRSWVSRNPTAPLERLQYVAKTLSLHAEERAEPGHGGWLSNIGHTEGCATLLAYLQRQEHLHGLFGPA